MPSAHYERLSALDASFLELEDENIHMHVAATLVFDAGPLRTPQGGLDMERIRDYLAARLHIVPRYRQRLAWIPIERHPVWIDDARFNVFYHMRHTALPRPGEERQLKRLCGRILSQKLDLTKPLWEMWVVEGLQGDRFALVAKAHHAMVDGISGFDILKVLLSATPETTFDPGPVWRPRPAPSSAELVADELRRRSSLPLGLARAAVRAVTDPKRALSSARDATGGLVEALGGASTPASNTPFNPELGPHRRLDWLGISLADVKAVKNRWGGTVNDVVLATVVGGARRFLVGRGLRPEGLEFRAMIPVSVRADNELGYVGNKVAQLLARLPMDEPDPYARYRRVVETTTTLKSSHQVEGSELLKELSDWTATAVLTEIMRFTARRRAYNVIVTNVPGPATPLHLLGAPMREAYPVVPLFPNQGVGIALFSYAGGLFWGILADWDALPDLHDLVEALRSEFDLLLRLARNGTSAA